MNRYSIFFISSPLHNYISFLITERSLKEKRMEQPPTGYEQQPQDYWQQRSPYLQQQEQWQREYEDQQRQNQYYEQNWQYKTSKEGFSAWSMTAKIATGSLAFLFLILVCVLFTGIGPSKESTNKSTITGATIISTQVLLQHLPWRAL